ncbi:gliding motility-associated C-terminal domain-containing protein [Solitalea sp. MAHUQ-68]|uniref:Gliding motility-associated C-terminal domain-containing protein n=1 Tax=Solitalea agri TaxID=2953739 RepID=A0A9X2JEA0_9SPHI|nr:gliding motility-associated C-terminal domain-containing protein [Solitalea agri]MCO4293740.1 gliding motility-associated C-terminal domain-containing protein [Solitalea agri]
MELVYKSNAKPNHMKFKRSFTIRLTALVSLLLTYSLSQQATAFPTFLLKNKTDIHHQLYFSFLEKSTFAAATITNNFIIQPTNPGNCPATFFDPSIIVGSDAGPSGTTYKWQKSTDLGVTWSDIGVTTRDYNPPTLVKTTWYHRIAINGPDQDESNIIRFVIAPVGVGNNSISKDQDIVSGAVPQLLVGTTPNGGDGISYEYLWEQTTDGVNWQVVSGTFNAKDYQPQALTVNTYFRRTVKMGLCTELKSNTVKISIVEVQISNNTIIQPLDNEKCGIPSFDPQPITGAAATVTVGATLSYQWERSLDGGVTYNDIAGANSQNYDPPALTQTVRFRRKVISGVKSDVSNTVYIIVNPDGITNNVINPISDVKSGVTPDLITGSDPLPAGRVFDFNWEQSDDDANWSPAIGTNKGKNYQPQPLTKTTYFRRKIGSGVCPSTVSASIKVTVLPSLPISNNKITAPPSTVFCGLASVDPSVITGTTANNVVSYQWQQSFNNSTWTNITDAVSVNYDPSNLTKKTYFRRIALAGSLKDTSNVVPFIITPIALDDNEIISAPQSVPSGGTPAVIAGSQPSGGDGTYKYLWEKSEGGQNNWVAATGVNNQINYQPSPQTSPVYYRRTVTSGACSVTSEKYLVAIITSSDLAINKEGGISDDVEGAVQFIITITNKGPQDASNVMVRDTLSDDLVYISAKSDDGLIDYDPVKKIITWEIDELADQQEMKLRINATPLKMTNIKNTAYVTAAVVDNDLSNNFKKAVIKEVAFGIDQASVPNMITPNGDGKNDVFKIPNIASFPTNELTVMDRWGNRVYTIRGYQNDWSAEGLPEGTYFYVLKITVGNKLKVYKGYLTLMRSRISG